MKNFASRSILVASISSLAACGGGSEANPPILYLAPDASELLVKLVGTEPPPY